MREWGGGGGGWEREREGGREGGREGERGHAGARCCSECKKIYRRRGGHEAQQKLINATSSQSSALLAGRFDSRAARPAAVQPLLTADSGWVTGFLSADQVISFGGTGDPIRQPEKYHLTRELRVPPAPAAFPYWGGPQALDLLALYLKLRPLS